MHKLSHELNMVENRYSMKFRDYFPDHYQNGLYRYASLTEIATVHTSYSRILTSKLKEIAVEDVLLLTG